MTDKLENMLAVGELEPCESEETREKKWFCPHFK